MIGHEKDAWLHGLTQRDDDDDNNIIGYSAYSGVTRRESQDEMCAAALETAVVPEEGCYLLAIHRAN